MVAKQDQSKAFSQLQLFRFADEFAGVVRAYQYYGIGSAVSIVKLLPLAMPQIYLSDCSLRLLYCGALKTCISVECFYEFSP